MTLQPVEARSFSDASTIRLADVSARWREFTLVNARCEKTPLFYGPCSIWRSYPAQL